MMKRVCLGKITGAHGVKGLVKIKPYAENLDLLSGALFTSENGAETLSVTVKSLSSKSCLAAVEGITERNGAEAIGGTKLYMDRSALPETEDSDSYYYEDLIGLAARNTDSADIGRIKDVQNFGAGELLEIQLNDGTEFYFPLQNCSSGDVQIDEGYVCLREYEMFIL